MKLAVTQLFLSYQSYHKFFILCFKATLRSKALNKPNNILIVTVLPLLQVTTPRAGFTLQLHADQLQWSPRVLHADLLYPAQTEMSRKEYIYHKIIEYFDMGKVEMLFLLFFKL